MNVWMDGIRAHNTLSAETTHVQVFYPFHPLHGVTLQIVRKPKRGDGAVSIIEPNGTTAEDSGVDAVAGMRRDKDYGATAFE